MSGDICLLEHGVQLVYNDLLRSLRLELVQRHITEGDGLSKSSAKNCSKPTRSDVFANGRDILAYFRQRKVIFQCSRVRNR